MGQNQIPIRFYEDKTQGWGQLMSVGVWGAHIPYLPEIEAGASSRGSDPIEQTFRSWLRFVAGIAQLPVDKHITFDLRFRLAPAESDLSRIELALFGASEHSQKDEALRIVESNCRFAWSALTGLLPPEYPLQSMSTDEFDGWLCPYGDEPVPYIVELRKRVVPLGGHFLKKIAYRFRASAAGPVQTCRALLERNRPCMISVAVSPAQLTETERREINTSLSATLESLPSMSEVPGQVRAKALQDEYAELLGDEQRMSRQSRNPSGVGGGPFDAFGDRAQPLYQQPANRAGLQLDPQVMAALDMHSRYLSASALLALRITVTAPANDTADDVAYAFGAELVGPAQNEQALALSGFSVVSPGSDKANQMLNRLRYVRVQSALGAASSGQGDKDGSEWGRLPVLCMPDDAAAAFRLPAVTGAWSGIPTRPLSPFRPATAFWHSRRPDEKAASIELGQIVDETSRYHGLPRYTIRLDELTQHALIVGGTGSGKTGTGLKIAEEIRRLPEASRPHLLLIDPVKTELRPFLRQTASAARMLAFSAGSVFSPLYLDAFRVPDGISPEQHLQILTGCFSAAFPMGGPLELLLTRSLRDAYRELYGSELSHPVAPGAPRPETPEDMLLWLAQLAAERIKTYSGDIRGNLTAAVQHRLEWLAEGTVGRLLVPRAGDSVLDIDTILRSDVLVELRLLPGNEEKALVMAVLLSMLGEHYTYSMAAQGKMPDTVGRLRHVIWIDEAQRLLSGSATQVHDPEVANARARAIELFVEMLSEMRSRGEGLIISTQLPSLLDPRVRKHPGMKIMHRLTPEDDRSVLGATMDLSPEQLRFVSQLEAGTGIVFRGQLPAAVMVKVDDVRYEWAKRLSDPEAPSDKHWLQATVIPDADVAKLMENAVFGTTKGQGRLRVKGCPFCSGTCERLEEVKRLWSRHDKNLDQQLLTALRGQKWQDLEALAAKILSNDPETLYCAMSHMLQMKTPNGRLCYDEYPDSVIGLQKLAEHCHLDRKSRADRLA